MAKLIFPTYVIDEMTKTLQPATIKRYNGWYKKYLENEEYTVQSLLDFKPDAELKAKNKEYISVLYVVIKLIKIELERSENKKRIKQKLTTQLKKLEKDAINARSRSIVVATATESDTKNKITMEQINLLKKQTQESYDQKETVNNAYHLQFLEFITSLPVLRTQDYINSSFFDTEGVNFMDTSNKLLKIKGGKVANSKRDIKIPKALNDLIIKNKETFGSDWLFPQLKKKNKPMTTAGFTKYLNRLFGMNISTSRLRQAYVSNLADKKTSVADRVKIAGQMGHTFQTSQQSYQKYAGDDPDGLKQDNQELIEMVNELQKEIFQLKEKLKST